MNKRILLIIDMQQALADEQPHDFNIVLNNIQQLLINQRINRQPVIHVQHCAGRGTELEPDTPGWQIVEELKPAEGELVIKKRFNCSFKYTNLEEEIRKHGDFSELVITGMQTEYCVDTTIRSAYEKSFKVIVPEKTHTTFDNEYLTAEQIYNHHNKIFKNRFAEIIPVEDLLQ